MRISFKALAPAKFNAFRLATEVDEETGVEMPITHPVAVIMITPELMDRASELTGTTEDYVLKETSPDVSIGDILTIERAENGQITLSIHNLTQAYGDEEAMARLAPFCMIDPRHTNLDAGVLPLFDNLSSAREVLRNTQDQESFTPAHARALEGINAMVQHYSGLLADPDHGLPGNLMAQVMALQIVDANPTADFRVSVDDLQRYFLAKQVRHEIGLMDPAHPDAPTTRTNLQALRGFLSDVGAQVSPGAMYRAAMAAAAADPARRPLVAAVEDLNQRVFQNITHMNIDDMVAGMVPSGRAAALIDKLRREANQTNGHWVDAMSEDVKAITRAAMPNYDFDAYLFTHEGHDILIIEDSVMKRRMGNAVTSIGAAIYSWPTDQRRIDPILAGETHFSVGPEQIPTQDDVDRLLREFRQMRDARMENNPGMVM